VSRTLQLQQTEVGGELLDPGWQMRAQTT